MNEDQLTLMDAMNEDQLTLMLRWVIDEMNRLRQENQRLRAALADQQAESVEGALAWKDIRP